MQHLRSDIATINEILVMNASLNVRVIEVHVTVKKKQNNP